MPKSAVSEKDRIVGWLATAPIEEVRSVLTTARSIVARRSGVTRAPKGTKAKAKAAAAPANGQTEQTNQA